MITAETDKTCSSQGNTYAAPLSKTGVTGGVPAGTRAGVVAGVAADADAAVGAGAGAGTCAAAGAAGAAGAGAGAGAAAVAPATFMMIYLNVQPDSNRPTVHVHMRDYTSKFCVTELVAALNEGRGREQVT